MKDLRQAAQQALEALEGWDNHDKWVWPESALEQAKRNTKEAIPALRAALAEHDRLEGIEAIEKDAGIHVSQQDEPEQQPVAWMDREGDVYKELPSPHWCPPHTPLYAHPRTLRKPLTDWEMVDIYKKWDATPGVSMADFARAIERAHGITGDSK